VSCTNASAARAQSAAKSAVNDVVRPNGEPSADGGRVEVALRRASSIAAIAVEKMVVGGKKEVGLPCTLYRDFNVSPEG
jgi:hypothetical protein